MHRCLLFLGNLDTWNRENIRRITRWIVEDWGVRRSRSPWYWFDTAEAYGNGRSERALANALTRLGKKPSLPT
jgi:predicted oxidoreductase